MLSGRPKAQLWRLEVASNKEPRLWSEQRSDKGELNEARTRQLDGGKRTGSQTGRVVDANEYERL